jgi:hypothetical protein
MKRFLMAIFILVAAILFVEGTASAQVLVVGTKSATCAAPQYAKIQDAIDAAAAGATIHVCAGVYPEQLLITKSLTVHGDSGAWVQPANMTANVSTLSESTSAVIYVSNAADVNINGLIIDASKNGIAECAPFLVGVLYQNSSGTLDHNAIRDTKLSAALDGCQSGDGVDVISTGIPTTVTISNNSIHGYQKNGITVNETGTTATVMRNVVKGQGRTYGAAENGIQIAFGAQGQIINNIVTNHQYIPCTGPDSCSPAATGILIYQSNGVAVEQNTLEMNQLGVYVQGNNASVTQNVVVNTLDLDGISLIGNSNTASQNRVIHSDQANIVIDGANNEATNNEVMEAPVGIWKVTGSTGTVINTNRFFATPVEVLDPAANRSVQVQPRH